MRRRRWRDATNVDYEPPVLDRLRESLNYLHHAAHPYMGSTSTSTVGGGRASGGFSSEATPDAARTWLRKQLKRIESRLDEYAKEAMQIAEGEYKTKSSWWCPECRRGHRPWEQFCSRCGTRRPSEPAESQGGADYGEARQPAEHGTQQP